MSTSFFSAVMAMFPLLAAITACGPQANSTASAIADLSGQRLVSRQEWDRFKDYATQFMIEADKCAPRCPMQTRHFQPSDRRLSLRTPVVMIIDEGHSVGAGLRHSSRVLGWYKVDDNGLIRKHQPVFTLPTQALQIFDLLDRPHEIIRPQWTEELSQSFHATFYSQGMQNYSHGHLNRVFSIISAYVPQAFYVIVESNTKDEAGHQNLCNMADAAAGRPAPADLALHKIEDRYDALADQIESIALKHNVGFINLSAGYSRRQLTRQGWFGCGRQPSRQAITSFLHLTKHYIARLSRIEGVTTVQSAVASQSRLVPFDDEAPGDCSFMPGRIRAGLALAKDSGLGPFGRTSDTSFDPLSLVPLSHRGAAACTDLFINFGYELNDEWEPEPGDFPIQSAHLGFGLRFKKSLDPQTSWAAPLLLAHLIHLQDEAWAAENRKLAGTELLERARGYDPDVQVIDPLRFKYFSALTIR